MELLAFFYLAVAKKTGLVRVWSSLSVRQLVHGWACWTSLQIRWILGRVGHSLHFREGTYYKLLIAIFMRLFFFFYQIHLYLFTCFLIFFSCHSSSCQWPIAPTKKWSGLKSVSKLAKKYQQLLAIQPATRISHNILLAVYASKMNGYFNFALYFILCSFFPK